MSQLDSTLNNPSPRRPNFIHWLRYVAMAEGISFLLLLFIAMPLKYLADMPLMVSVVGMAHGVLFIALIFALALAKPKLPWKWVGLVFIASLLPFGPFVVDPKLRKFE